MSRPRKPIEDLSRKHKGRGFVITKEVEEIQQEIVFQFNRIKTSLKTIDPIKEVKTYKILIDELLKINNQMKTFSKISDEEYHQELLLEEVKEDYEKIV
jgi:predicted RNA-binding protein YlxR (DUF448 family)